VTSIKGDSTGAEELRRALQQAQRAADEAIAKAIDNPNIDSKELGEILGAPMDTHLHEHPAGRYTDRFGNTFDDPHHDHAEGRYINVLTEEPDQILAATEKVVIRPAVDSGAVKNVIHPKELPLDAEPQPNTSGSHFVGANHARIERYGSCKTRLDGPHGSVGCDWELADVSRPLHSVSCIAGPVEGPGLQDVLFNNKRCVVVPPGVVDRILREVTPVMEYKREGNLYLAELTMSAFARHGQEA
jgi:hypothetical protein